MASYAEDRAKFIAQAQQRQVQQRVNEIQQEHRQAVAELDQCVAAGDMESAHYRALEANQLQAEYAQYVPPRMDPKAAGWVRKHQDFFNRHGVQADAAVQGAHKWLTRQGNAGWVVGSPAYYKAIEDLLELHGQHYFGVRFDPSEGAGRLNATQAAKISNVSAQTYNNQAQRIYNLKRQGKLGS
jgi:hypothetical protein